MIYDVYNKKILDRMEKSFNRLLPICAVASILSAIAIYFSPIPNYFVMIDGFIGSVFLYLTALKNIVTMETKIITTISVGFLICVLSFLDGGFGSAAMLLLMIINLISVVFLSKKFSNRFAILSALVFVGLWIHAWFNPIDISADDEIAKWIIHLVVMVLYLLVLNTIVYSVKIYLIENIIKLEKSNEKTFKYAYFDHLTGLPNYERFIEKLTLDTKKNENGYLVYFSVMNLNLINSIYSDDLGDQVLISIKDVMLDMKKEAEIIARIGGNEFALWIPFSMHLAFAQRIQMYLENLNKDLSIEGLTKQPKYYVACNKHVVGDNLTDTIHKTRLALTFAKSHAIEDIVFYDEALDKLICEEDALKDAIKMAITNKSFSVFYQQKRNIMSDQVVGLEALARWQHEDNFISPVRFIPLVEDMNLSVEFGELMIDNIFKDFPRVDELYGTDASVSINISPSHLASEKFSYYLSNKLEEYGIDPHRITIEITEDIMIENFEFVVRLINRIKKIGVKISLDDFGSGYSSLNYLAVLDIDELKIDKSFIDQIFYNHKINIMLESIIKLSHQYSLTVVAEGVETKKQYDMIKSLGCDEIQGYYFHKPNILE